MKLDVKSKSLQEQELSQAIGETGLNQETGQNPIREGASLEEDTLLGKELKTLLPVTSQGILPGEDPEIDRIIDLEVDLSQEINQTIDLEIVLAPESSSPAVTGTDPSQGREDFPRPVLEIDCTGRNLKKEEGQKRGDLEGLGATRNYLETPGEISPETRAEIEVWLLDRLILR